MSVSLSSLVIPSYTPAPESAPLHAVFPLSHHKLLCYGALPQPLSPKDTIFIHGTKAEKPYQGILTGRDKTAMTLLIVPFVNANNLPPVENILVERAQTSLIWRRTAAPHPSRAAWLSTLPASTLTSLFALLCRLAASTPQEASDPDFVSFCHAVRLRLAETEESLAHLSWITPHMLTLHGTGSLPSQASLMITSSQGLMIVPLHSLSPHESEAYWSATAWLENFATNTIQSAKLTLVCGVKIIPLAATLPATHPSPSALLAWLETLSPLERQRVREDLLQLLLAHNESAETEVHELIRIIQLFTLVPHSTASQPEHPFGMGVDFVVPLNERELFVAFWRHDPLQLAESEALIADLGFRFSISSGTWHRFARTEIAAHYRHSAYPADHSCGFFGIVPITEEIAQKMHDRAQFHSFRLEISLRGGLYYHLNAPPPFPDTSSARNALLHRIAPYLIPDSAAAATLQRAIEELHRQSQEIQHETAIIRIGQATTEAPLSIIITLPENLREAKCQLAALSITAAARNCEFVCLLNHSQEQALAVRELEALSKIYGIAITLVISNAALIVLLNEAARLACAPRLLFLSPMTHPIHETWLETLLNAHTGPGPLGAKLLWEDGSIFEAGVSFERASFLPERRFRGYPRTFPAAQENEYVDALGNDCLMIGSALFTQLGGLCENYLTPRVAAYDLCLRARTEGYASTYCARAEFYCFAAPEANRPEENKFCPAQLYDAERLRPYLSPTESSMEPVSPEQNGSCADIVC